MSLPPDQPDHHPADLDRLRPCPADCAAIDALVDAGLDLTRVPEPHRARAARILDLLNGLVPALPAERPLIDATLDRLAADDRPTTGGWQQPDSGLAPWADEALEALVSARFDPARVPSAVRDEALAQHAVLDLLATPLAAERDRASWEASREALVARTLSGLQDAADDEERRMTIGPTTGRWSSLRKWDLIGVAAAVAIGASVLMPVLGSLREQMRQTTCQNNLAVAGLGFGQYALDYRGSMPMASASLAGAPWWLVGRDHARSNSANLFTLARAQYTSLDPLRCSSVCESPVGRPAPGQMDWARLDQVSYSSQNLFSSYRPDWSYGPRMVVMADRSPLVRRAVAQPGPIRLGDMSANSPTHGGTGQNVLWTDGSAQWLTSPVLENGDNLWLPLALEIVLDQINRSRQAGADRGIIILRGIDDLEPGNSFLVP